MDTQPPPLLADYDGRNISETGGLRHPETSEPLAASLRHLAEAELIQALEKETLGIDSLLDLALISASEGKNAAAAALVERIAQEITGENDALRCSARLLASGQHELAGVFAAKLVTRITSTVMLSTIFNMMRRHCYQHAIKSLRYENEGDVFALRDKLSELAFTLFDSKEPLLARRLFGTSELDAYSLDCPDFTPRPMHPAPPSILGEKDADEDLSQTAFRANSGKFARLTDVRLIGSRPHAFFQDIIIDDVLILHPHPDDFTPYGDEWIYFRYIYHFMKLPSGERWLIARDVAPTRNIPRGILLNGPYQANYWHLLAEHLLLLPALSCLPESCADWPLIISRDAFSSPNLEAAVRHVLALTHRNVEIIEKDEVVCVRELIIPPRLAQVKSCQAKPGQHPENIILEPESVRQLHALLALPPAGRRRFFLARSQNARLSNQDEVRQAFEQRGFETIYPERLSFDEARALFAQAAVIAGPTGAAFANLFLCPAGTVALIFIGDFYSGISSFSAIGRPLGQTVIHIACPSTSLSFASHTYFASPEKVAQALNIVDGDWASELPVEGEETEPASIPADKRAYPLVSILIPAFKPRWFEQALCSAIAQDYPEKEILVFDNCPSEEIREICDKYPMVRYWRNPNTRLQNIVDITAASRGRYIKHLFDDDLLEPSCVSELVAALEARPEARLAFAASWMIDENSQRLGIRQQVETPVPVHCYDGNAICRALARDCGNMIGEFSSVLIDGPWLRENVQRLIRAEASHKDLVGLCDVAFFMNASAGRPVPFVNKPLTSFRMNRESNSNPERNPDYLFVITDWRLVIEEADALGVLTREDLGVARNSYNNRATMEAERNPGLAEKIYPTLFALEELPEHPAFLEYETLTREGRDEEAIALLIALAEKNSAYWKVFQALGDHAFRNQDLPLALNFYGQAALKAGSPVRENIAYALLLDSVSRKHEAEALLKRYLDHFPGDAEAQRALQACARPATSTNTMPPLPATDRTAPADDEHFGQQRYERWLIRRSLGGMQASDYENRVRKLWKFRPLFEFFMILPPGGEAFLADSIDSLSQQYYDGWRLSIFAQTPSPDAEFTEEKSAVRWFQIAGSESLPQAANERLHRSPAGWIAFFDCGTRFAPELLLACGDHIALHPEWRLIYSDEDAIDAEGIRKSPRFKPDFNLELLRSTGYFGNFFVEKRTLLSAGGYSGIAGAECLDMALNVADAAGENALGHIPDVLVHIPAACRQSDETAAMQALRNHLARRKLGAEVLPGLAEGVTRRILYHHPETPRVTIIIPTRNRLELLKPCVDSLFAQTRYPDWELVLVDNGSDDPETLAYYNELRTRHADRIQLLHFEAPFNFSAMNNLAATHARGDYLLLLNNDTVCIHDDWLDAMMSHAQRPEVGIVGARLLFPNSLKVQHAGVVLGMTGTAGHPFINTLAHDDPGYLNRALADQEFSAVTGACLLIRKSIYEKVGGLNEQDFKVSFNDIDLCLKVRQQGYRILWTPFATLLHHGSATQLVDARNPQKISAFQQESNQFYLRWKPQIFSDPAWNRNLSLCETHPALEDELAVPWSTDFHDRPRILVMPVPSQGAAEYRNLGPLRALHAAGKVHYASVCQPRVHFERAPMPVELSRLAPDVLVMHAPVDNVRGQALLRYALYNPEIFRIYALDDLISHIPASNPTYHALPADAVYERLQLGLKASHRMVVSTEPLLQAYRHLIDDIRLVPNSLEWSTWGALQPQRRHGKKLRVGWAGAQQHAGDLRFMLEVIQATCADVDWIFFGMMPEGAQPYVSEFHDFLHDFSAYPAKLAALDLDLAVAPLEIHPFNEAKSNLRLLEYGILGWPVICTDIFPYQTDNPPVTRLPNDASRWIAAIRERIADPDALAREGDALREWVKRHYLLENRLDEWLSAFSR